MSPRLRITLPHRIIRITLPLPVFVIRTTMPRLHIRLRRFLSDTASQLNFALCICILPLQQIIVSVVDDDYIISANYIDEDITPKHH